jgi:hypothetical protein
MTDITAPWSTRVLDTPVDNYSATSRAVLRVGGYSGSWDLVIDGGTIDWQARRTPTISADLDIVWPDEQVRALLDPRRQALTIEVWAGYEYTDAVEDTQRMVTLRVDEAQIDHGQRTVHLRAFSDEVIALGYPVDSTISVATTDTIVSEIQALVAGAYPGESLTWVLGDGVQKTKRFTVAATITPGEDRWQFVQDWADSIGCWVWHDGNGTWRIDKQVTLPVGASVASLRTGKRGTVSSLVTTETRDGYANQAMAIYEYTEGASSYRACHIAKPDPVQTPVAMATETYSFKPQNGAATASQMLSRGLRRGHGVEVEATVYWWIRPDGLVTVMSPDGLLEQFIVDLVSFDLGSGTMRLTGQAPDPAIDRLVITTTSTVSTL